MEQTTENPHKNKVHKVLAQGYFFYFFCFMIGIYLNIIFNVPIFRSPSLALFGFEILTLATILIIWAQNTTRNFKKDSTHKINKETFCGGPYRYIKNPTHLGLFLAMLSFGIIINSFFIVLFALILFVLDRFLFLDKQDKILAEKYGAPYLEYKKSVKF
jgi:protein-S-isoprenylcysteine O-methyltransferase Ste14